MGASAGGLEAFQKFFTNMPSDSGIAFVLVQHLDPRHATLMPELLARHTRMSVEQAKDPTPVEPDHVYVIPPNATLTIEGGVLRVQTPLPLHHQRTPIDRFFRSLAEDQGDRAVCILLSGSGTDGTLGLRAVKEHGGMAMAQASESAKHDSIPRSAIATGLVDHVLPVEEMPARLVEYVAHLRELQEKKGPEAIQEEAADHLAKICALLRRSTGHEFSQYKQTTLVRRIQRRLQVLQLPSVAVYMERLHQDPMEVEQLFKDLLIGVTHFFRDPEAFEVLAREVVPRIFERAGAEGPVRAWTPGCATGEEAYSVAILLREEMIRRVVQPLVQIFAGDIDQEALELARHGRYPVGIAAQVSPERLERFFVKEDHSYVIAKQVRDMCIFSTHSLIKDPPFRHLDLIVCRNLLIYLEPDLQKDAIQLFHYSLRPEGYLFLGPSEHVAGPSDLFRTLDKKYRIFQRNETVLPLPAPFPLASMLGAERKPTSPERRAIPSHRTRELESVAMLERILVQNYSPAWVVINAEGEIVYFSPRTGRYLEPPVGAPSTNLVTMARKGLRIDLRTAIHQAIKTGKPAIREDVTVESDGASQRINLIVRPLTELGKDRGFFMVVFQELGPSRRKDHREAEDPDAQGAGDTVVQQLESELRTTKEHLQATIEELESSNEELTSSNEELSSTTEELQSSNEELQTSKEELQSVNEELETINMELSKKVEELDVAYSDVQNLFESTRIATLFLDREMRIKRFTPAAIEIFPLIATDLGRPIGDIASSFPDENFLDDIKDALRTLTVKQRTVRLPDGSAVYLMRILPYRSPENVIGGVVVTFADVTELGKVQAQQARLAAIVESSQDAIVGRTFEGTITTWNAAATRMFGYTAEEAIGAPVSLFVPPERQEELKSVHERVRRGDAIGPFESERLTKDGYRLPVSVTVSPCEGRGGPLDRSLRDLP